VEGFVLALRGLLEGRSLDIVDFCSGTGNLLLPLAALFPRCRFHAIEMKPNAVAILLARAAAAQLSNVTAEVCRQLYCL
jgi:tRNA G46 methylase TrmB